MATTTQVETDEIAVERVLRDYFDRIDALDPEGAVQHFAPDAQAEVMTGKTVDGRDRIGRALRRILVAYEVTEHHLTNVRATVNGDEAETWGYVFAYHRMAATGKPWLLWVFLYDRFRRIDGEWKIVYHALHGTDSEPPRADIPQEWYTGHRDRAAVELPPRGRRGLEAIRIAAPDVIAGLDKLRAVVEMDGALPAATKALIAATVAAAKGHDELLRTYLMRAKGEGLEASAAWGAASVLPTSRGEAVAERFALGVREAFGPPEPGPAGDDEDPGEYFKRYYGEIPARWALLAERSPAAFEGFFLLHRGSLRQTALDPKVSELIVCALAAADYEPDFLRIHANAAVGIGASKDEVIEGVLCALPVAGLAVWTAAASVLAELP